MHVLFVFQTRHVFVFGILVPFARHVRTYKNSAGIYSLYDVLCICLFVNAGVEENGTLFFAKFRVLSKKNGVNIWTFVRKTGVTCVVTWEVRSYRTGSTSGVKCDLMLALRIQIFECLHETICKPWSTCHRPVDTWEYFFFFLTETPGHRCLFF